MIINNINYELRKDKNKKDYYIINNYCGNEKNKKIIIEDFINGIPVKKILNHSFTETRIEEVILPNTIELIGENSFCDCSRLQKINLDSVRIIRNNAFRSCRNLKNINLQSAESIGKNAFKSCESIKELKIGKNSTSSLIIGESAFLDCLHLEKVEFENNYVFINDSAFSFCDNLSEINLDKAVSIGKFILEETKIEKVIIKENCTFSLNSFVNSNIKKINIKNSDRFLEFH